MIAAGDIASAYHALVASIHLGSSTSQPVNHGHYPVMTPALGRSPRSYSSNVIPLSCETRFFVERGGYHQDSLSGNNSKIFFIAEFHVF